MTTKAPKWLDDPEDMPIEWREKYPKVMRWEDVPEDRRVTPEFVLSYRGDFGKGEAARLSERRCEMAIDYGSRWGKRFGMYARCGNPPLPGETLCSHHGGPKRIKQPRKVRPTKPFDTDVCDGWLFEHCDALTLVLGIHNGPKTCSVCGEPVDPTPVKVRAKGLFKDGDQP